MYFLTMLTSILFFVVATADNRRLDCIDSKRKLKCVLSFNCREEMKVPTKGCPKGRVCCLKFNTNLYLPLRRVPTSLPLLAPPTPPPPLSTPPPQQPDWSKLVPNLKIRGVPNLQPRALPQIFEGTEFKSGHNINSIENADSIAFPLEGGKYITHEPDVSRHKPVQDEAYSSENRNIVHEIYETLEPGEKSAKYCKEYTKLSIEYTRVMPLLPEVIPMTIEMETCAPRFTPLIVGGKNATIEEFPHMAALGFYRNDDIDFLCGGTLISDDFILTAAHCTNTRWGPPVLVNVGSSELYDSNSVQTPIADIIPHPDYKPPSCYNDIALIRLETKLKLSLALRPACLPTPETKAQYAGNVAIATGWGKTGFGRESSLNLLRVSLKILDNLKCGEYYAGDTKTTRLQNGITTNMICASGHEDSSHDTCQGDSGGPLQAFLPESECTLQVVGVTSFGKSCGMGIPGVYTRIAPYVPWIESIVWP